MTRLLRLLGAAAAAAVLVAACGGGSDETTASGGATTTAPSSAAATTSAPAASATTTAGGGGGTAADSGTITIKDFLFGEPLTVKPGATITVVNQDVPRHDVVADQGNLFKTPLLGQGEKATFTAPAAPGTYTFSCSVHANMTGIGTLVVKG